MNLKNYSDQKLLIEFAQIAGEERATVVKALYYFREVEARRLFSDLKFKSLRKFAVGFLKYSGDQADRRIAAMRMMRELPGIERKILDGSLNLTNLLLARILFRREKKAGRDHTPEQKREILQKFENVSIRKAQKLAAEINPEMRKREINFDSIEDKTLREKLLKLKGQRAHKNPHLTLTELLHELADMALVEKKTAAPRKNSQAETSRELWERDHAECTNCGSFFAIQEDHITPKAAGGATSVENMRLLCRNCNLRAAIKFYGRKKMNDYLSDVHRPYGALHKHHITPARPRMRQTSTQKRNAYN